MLERRPCTRSNCLWSSARTNCQHDSRSGNLEAHQGEQVTINTPGPAATECSAVTKTSAVQYCNDKSSSQQQIRAKVCSKHSKHTLVGFEGQQVFLVNSVRACFKVTFHSQRKHEAHEVAHVHVYPPPTSPRGKTQPPRLSPCTATNLASQPAYA